MEHSSVNLALSSISCDIAKSIQPINLNQKVLEDP